MSGSFYGSVCLESTMMFTEVPVYFDGFSYAVQLLLIILFLYAKTDIYVLHKLLGA